MNLNIIYVATFYGCDRQGVELGPKYLKDNKLEDIILSLGHKINNSISINIPNHSNEKFKDSTKIKYLDEIYNLSQRLCYEVDKSYKEGAFPLIIGGDHSISIGSLSGFSNNFKNKGVIWIDAHGDLNTHNTSPSCNAHGMPLASSLGYGHEKFLSLFDETIDPRNVFLYGIRSLDKGEKDFIINNEMHIYDINSFNSLDHSTMIDIMKKYISKNQIDNFHLSFDIDVFDPNIVPGTGTPVKNGLYIEEMESFLDKLTSCVNIVSMDFVEFNPLLDKDNKTLKTCLHILEFLLRRIGK